MKNYLLIICFVFLIGCNKKEDKPITEKEFKMYQMSEMSLLMEQMYVDNMRLKEKILKNESFGEFQNYFLKIHTSKFTDSTDNNEHFKKNAVIFINSQKLIFTDSVNAKHNFNKMVQNCISCHEGNCGGPIVKIKKLLIPEQNK
jgi:hypothetical protein